MQPMMHNPGALGVGSQVVANGARGLAAGPAATAEVPALVPAGAEEVSMAASLAFASEGIQTMLLNAFAQEELARVGQAIIESAGIYTTADTAIAATLI